MVAMRFSLLTLLAGIIASTAVAGVVEQRAALYSLTPEEWQAKWDAWPSIDASRLSARAISSNETALLDICGRFQGCVGKAAATAAGYTAVAAVATANFCAARANAATNALMAMDYKLAKQIAAYVATEVALPFIVNFGTYYINLRLQNDAPQSKVDDCGISQNAAIAEQAGTATYGFCLQLRQVTSDKAFSRVDFGTVSSSDTNNDVGLDMKMRLLISTVNGKYGVACSLLGVQLKRGLSYLL